MVIDAYFENFRLHGPSFVKSVTFFRHLLQPFALRQPASVHKASVQGVRRQPQQLVIEFVAAHLATPTSNKYVIRSDRVTTARSPTTQHIADVFQLVGGRK